MITVTKPAEVFGIVRDAKCEGKRIGFVPTMGDLHEGHLSLVRLARERTDFVVVSIFVNPKQFGPQEDLAQYPRDETGDAEKLESLGCDLLFTPVTADIYSPADRTSIRVEKLSDVLCGESRSGHFHGVALVVAKLFNMVQPDEAFFGQKDAQQAVIIQRMTADLDCPIRIILGPTVREPDGLAMSSRNTYLSSEDRERAAALSRALRMAHERIRGGERDAGALRTLMRDAIASNGIDVDYAEIVDGETLEPMETVTGTVLCAVAGRVGGTRLIDNVALTVSGSDVTEVLLEFPGWSRYDF